MTSFGCWPQFQVIARGGACQWSSDTSVPTKVPPPPPTMPKPPPDVPSLIPALQQRMTWRCGQTSGFLVFSFISWSLTWRTAMRLSLCYKTCHFFFNFIQVGCHCPRAPHWHWKLRNLTSLQSVKHLWSFSGLCLRTTCHVNSGAKE